MEARDHLAPRRWSTKASGAAVAGPCKPRGRPPGSKNGVRKVCEKEPKPVKWW
jgi:hypothetical protein